MIIIKILHFVSHEELARALSDEYKEIKEKDDLDSVGVIAKYNDAKEIVVELIRLGYGIASISEFSDGCWNGYNDEYLVSLLEDEIWCQPIKIGNSYLTIENKLTYLLDDCNSKIISYINSPVIYEISVSDECNGDCDNCCDKDDSSIVYRVNDEEVSKDEYYDRLADIEEAFNQLERLEALQRILLW